MIQYIYFVKCPNCEDEHFDFFDEAKEFALSCLSKKPVITQTEVCRNDFGECTDHSDLGTVWSWEDMMKDVPTEPEQLTFSKADLGHDYDPHNDPEFQDDDFFAVNAEEPAVPAPEEEEEPRKSVPDNMTIEELVEAMQENEDIVECAGCEELFPKEDCVHKDGIGYLCGDCEDRVVKCTWCDELYDRSECRKEVDLGWLCDRCQAGIMSRGEPLTFRENDYWDFLDEKLDIDFSNCISASDHEIWGVTHEKDNMYKAVLLKRYENVSFSNCDECDRIHEEMYDIDGLFLFTFSKDGKPNLNSWNVDLLHRLGSIMVGFDDVRYEDALAKVFNKSSSGLNEASLKDVASAANSEYGGFWNEDDLLDFAGVEDEYRALTTTDDELLRRKAQEAEQAYQRKLNFAKGYIDRYGAEKYNSKWSERFGYPYYDEATGEFIKDSDLQEGWHELLAHKVEIEYPEFEDFVYVTNMDRITDVLVDIVTDEDVFELTNGRYKTVDEICDHKITKVDAWSAFLEENCEELYDRHEAEVKEALHEDAAEAFQVYESHREDEELGADPDGFFGWDDFYRWKNGDLR
jgi:hypothetical protein